MRVPPVVKGLGARLFLYQAVALALLLGAFGFLSLQTANRARDQALAHQLRIANAVARGLEEELDHISFDVLSYPLRPPSSSFSADVLAALEEHLTTQEGHAYFRARSVVLVDINGEVLSATPPEALGLSGFVPGPDAVRRATSARSPLALTARPAGTEPNAGSTVLVVPLPSSSFPVPTVAVVQLTGMAGIDLFSFTRAQGAPEDREAGEAGRPYALEVLSPDGTVLASSAGDGGLGATSSHYAAMQKFLLRRESGAIVHPPMDGRPSHIVAGVPVGDTPFFLITEEPQGLLLNWPEQLRNHGILVGITAAAIIIVLGQVIDRQVVQPLRRLRRATARIKGGDLETPVQVRAGGEIAQLVGEVDEMRARLRETVLTLQGLTETLADQVAERTERLQTVLQRSMAAQEEERRRIARDLHDETAQGLSTLGILLDEAALDAEGDGKQGLESISRAREQVNRLMRETRRLVYALRPSVLDDAGLVPALRWCAEAYLQSVGVHVSLHTSHPDARLPEPVEVALFRVGQEAMSNVSRHASASHVWVSLERKDDWAVLVVRDDGVGFDKEALMADPDSAGARGFGLAGMQERMALLGGSVDIVSVPGHGTTVTARVPCR